MVVLRAQSFNERKSLSAPPSPDGPRTCHLYIQPSRHHLRATVAGAQGSGDERQLLPRG